MRVTIKEHQRKIQQQENFGAEGIRNREKALKCLFLYYTGITYLFLFAFLFPKPDEKR